MVINLFILKLFNFCIMKEIKRNEFEDTYKNNLLILNLFFIFLFFFLSGYLIKRVIKTQFWKFDLSFFLSYYDKNVIIVFLFFK